jgi:AraC-like DNA-binding protein
MKDIHSIRFQNGTKEELLPDVTPDFPYIASHVEMDKYTERFVPWHWHKEVELFYIKSGVLEYYTPKGKVVFPAGSGGMVNSNVLHMTKPQEHVRNTVQLLHIFDTSFIGTKGDRIDQKYITPILSAHQLELFVLHPNNSEHVQILKLIQESFNYSDKDFGYEMKLRTVLSDIWLQLLTMSLPLLEEKEDDKINDKIKLMMIYVHEHYAEKISITKIAAAAFSSERECFRTFHDCLHMTPIDYVRNYRLQKACLMLTKSKEKITFISHACGFGSSSYLGKIFLEYIGCTPIEYRNKWQDNDI